MRGYSEGGKISEQTSSTGSRIALKTQHGDEGSFRY